MEDDPNHPYQTCKDYVPPSKHTQSYPFAICVSTERTKGLDRNWTPCNHRGPKCPAYVKGEQMRLEEF